MRAARTPPEPPPMTNRSTSNSVISTPNISPPGSKNLLLTRFLDANRDPLRSKTLSSDLLAAFAHLGAELGVDDFGETLRPLVHIGHRKLNCLGLGGPKFLAERRFVEGHEVLQFLLGKLAGIDLRHALADLLLAAGEALGDNDGDLVEVFLIVQISLQQRILGMRDDVGN